MRFALGALLAAVSVLDWTLDRAFRADPMPPDLPLMQPGRPMELRRPASPEVDVSLAVAHDPFHAERRRPKTRFRLPGESLGPQDSIPTVAIAAPLVLVGTAVMPEGRGFAMCERGGEPAKVVRVGERIGDLTLKDVMQGRAVFVTLGGQQVEFRVAKAGT